MQRIERHVTLLSSDEEAINASSTYSAPIINNLLEDGVRFREMLALLSEVCGVHIQRVRPNDWRIMDTSPGSIGLEIGGSYSTFEAAFRVAMQHVTERDGDE